MSSAEQNFTEPGNKVALASPALHSLARAVVGADSLSTAHALICDAIIAKHHASEIQEAKRLYKLRFAIEKNLVIMQLKSARESCELSFELLASTYSGSS